jgi:caffeoyl-CoA O-methyltransferase
MAFERLRPGGIVIADNMIRRGRIVEAGVSADNDGIRELHDLLAADSSLIATTIPVGDGLAVAVKKG